MSVWDSLVGQDHVRDILTEAVSAARRDTPDSAAMTHAWLITGPPGSGRSVAATSFALALVCPDGGCGVCRVCRDARAGRHSDVTIVRPAGVIIGVDQTRELVGRVAVKPTRGDWNVVVIEDADRLNEHADNALLKSLEEPPEHAVWILCAPSVDDVLPTIRSRCRVLRLRSPSASEVAAHLVSSEGVDPALAAYAARAAQGHIGRAKALALDDEVRTTHLNVLRIPMRLGSVATCMAVAGETLDAARARVDTHATALEARERESLMQAYGEGGKGGGSARSRAAGALKELEREQRNRRRRMLRDELDRVLIDLLGLYRDVLLILSGSDVPLINAEMATELGTLAGSLNAAGVLHRLDAISHARDALAADGSEDLVLTTLVLGLQRPRVASIGNAEALASGQERRNVVP
mgnify:CR=1 FL=1